MLEPDTIQVNRRLFESSTGTLRIVRWLGEIEADTRRITRWARALKVARIAAYVVVTVLAAVELVLIAGGVR